MQNQPGHSPPSAQAHTQLSGCRLRVGIFFFLLFFFLLFFLVVAAGDPRQNRTERRRAGVLVRGCLHVQLHCGIFLIFYFSFKILKSAPMQGWKPPHAPRPDCASTTEGRKNSRGQ